MNTIHDENKIKELMVTRFGYESTEVYKMTYSVNEVKELMRFYAEHIREKTIDECISCVPDEGKNVTFAGKTMNQSGIGAWDWCREQIITNLNNLKSNEKTN